MKTIQKKRSAPKRVLIGCLQKPAAQKHNRRMHDDTYHAHTDMKKFCVIRRFIQGRNSDEDVYNQFVKFLFCEFYLNLAKISIMQLIPSLFMGQLSLILCKKKRHTLKGVLIYAYDGVYTKHDLRMCRDCKSRTYWSAKVLCNTFFCLRS